MSRTTIDIDEEACAEVMRRYGFKTKREAVNHALRQEAREAVNQAIGKDLRKMTLDEARAMQGTGWDDGRNAVS